MVIFITGRPRTGKTTLGRYLLKDIEKSILLDGDELRNELRYDSYTEQGRRSWIDFVASIAVVLERQGYVPIIALVSPYSEARKEALSRFNSPILVFLPGGEKNMWEGSVYEEPTKDECKNLMIRSYKLEDKLNGT
jgi:adenylylsulfate kinase-like enzyme